MENAAQWIAIALATYLPESEESALLFQVAPDEKGKIAKVRQVQISWLPPQIGDVEQEFLKKLIDSGLETTSATISESRVPAELSEKFKGRSVLITIQWKDPQPKQVKAEAGL
jgi:hypothetical protein